MRLPRAFMKITFCLLTIAALSLSGCQSLPFKKQRAAVAAFIPRLLHPGSDSYWHGDDVHGPARITIDLSQQRSYFHKGDVLVGESEISSGRAGFETPVGRYKVIQKSKDHVSSLYGDYIDAEGEIAQANVDTSRDPKPPGAYYRGAEMPYFLRFKGGYGLHAGHLPGRAASHGCVRLPRRMAEKYFEHARIGTPVVVRD